MTLNINITAEIDPQEIKTIVKMAKKLGMAELLQQVAPTATTAPATEPELPIGTFTGGEEIPAEGPDPTPAPKRGRKPKATLGFR